MDVRQALSAFGALSQETRLAVVRTLVVAGPAGLAAGAIAERMGVSPSNISFHLKELERAGQLQLFTSPEWRQTDSGKTVLKFDLPQQGVSLLQLTW